MRIINTVKIGGVFVAATTLAGCNAADVVGNVPGLETVVYTSLAGVIGPIIMKMVGGLMKDLPRAALKPLEMVLGAVAAALTAASTAMPEWGLPALGGAVVAAVLRTLIAAFADAQAAVAAAQAGADVPKVSDVKVYVPKTTVAAGAGMATSAKGQKVTVNGFSPWSK